MHPGRSGASPPSRLPCERLPFPIQPEESWHGFGCAEHIGSASRRTTIMSHHRDTEITEETCVLSAIGRRRSQKGSSPRYRAGWVLASGLVSDMNDRFPRYTDPSPAGERSLIQSPSPDWMRTRKQSPCPLCLRGDIAFALPVRVSPEATRVPRSGPCQQRLSWRVTAESDRSQC
jgi:hypothetical protein